MIRCFLQTKMSQEPTIPKSLIVIGAGCAGLRLSEICKDLRSDITITILEANDYIGGRVRHTKFQTHTVEMGANWISGLEETYRNPVWQLAQKLSLQGHLVDRAEEQASRVLYNGKDVNKEYFETMDRFESICARAVQFCKTLETDRDVRSQMWLLARDCCQELV